MKKNKPDKNPMEGKRVIFIQDDLDVENADGVRGHLVVTGDSCFTESVYQKYIKRCIDVIISLFALLFLLPILIIISVAVFFNDPGPVIFTQKRIGKNKKYFMMHKFRSMKMSTPKDVPTHMLSNSSQYVTKVGRFLRAHSLDELPQLWDILVGNMSVIGPRPALWNQNVLVAERDKYDANDVKPGLTGWAQINGRDLLDVSEKARLDGEYVRNMGFGMDIKCFLKSLGVLAKDDTIVEGMEKR